MSKTEFLVRVQGTFTVQTPSHLGPLTQLTVSHEQAGQGWLLERVEVTDDGTGLLYIFFCGELLNASTSKVLQVILVCTLQLSSILCCAQFVCSLLSSQL